MTTKEIAANKTKELLEQHEAMLIDVREPDEYKAEHISGAINIPLSSLNSDTLAKMIESKKCVFQCLSGKRAGSVVKKLSDTSAEDSYVLTGGIKAWKKAGFTTVSKANKLSIFRQIQIIAGFFILTGTITGVLLNPKFLIIPAFFGTGLLFAGISGWCGMGILLQKMPWNKME